MRALIVAALILSDPVASAQEATPGYDFSYSSEWSGRVVRFDGLDPVVAQPYLRATHTQAERWAAGTSLTPLRLHYIVPGVSVVHGGAIRDRGADRTIGRYLMLLIRDGDLWRHGATYLHWSGADATDESSLSGDLVRFDRLDPTTAAFLDAATDECMKRLNNGTTFVPMRAHFATPGVAVVLGSAVKESAAEQRTGRYMMVLVQKDELWHFTDFFIHWSVKKERGSE